MRNVGALYRQDSEKGQEDPDDQSPTWRFSDGFRQFGLSVEKGSKCSDGLNKPYKVLIT